MLRAVVGELCREHVVERRADVFGRERQVAPHDGDGRAVELRVDTRPLCCPPNPLRHGHALAVLTPRLCQNPTIARFLFARTTAFRYTAHVRLLHRFWTTPRAVDAASGFSVDLGLYGRRRDAKHVVGRRVSTFFRAWLSPRVLRPSCTSA